MESRTIQLLIIGTTVGVQVAQTILAMLNMRYLNRHGTESPAEFADVIPIQARQRAVSYSLSTLRFDLLSGWTLTIVSIALLIAGIPGWIDERARSFAGATGTGDANLYLSGAFFTCTFIVLATIIALPGSYYRTFVIDQKFGFNRSTNRTWLRDTLLQFLLSVALTIIVITAFTATVRNSGPYWWILATGLMLGIGLIIAVIAPKWIMPLFNTFSPLEDEILGKKIEELCERFGFPLAAIYQIDGSKRTTKANAMIMGLGRTKRIALFDTLIQQMTHDQILAVIAHEIGHWRHAHVMKGIIISIPRLVLTFWLVSLAIDYRPLFEAFGITTPSPYAALAIFPVLLAPIEFIISPLFSWISKHNEYQADAFAVKAMSSPQPLITALVLLTEANATNAKEHWLYSFFHDSHPRLVDRIAGMRNDPQTLAPPP